MSSSSMSLGLFILEGGEEGFFNRLVCIVMAFGGVLEWAPLLEFCPLVGEIERSLFLPLTLLFVGDLSLGFRRKSATLSECLGKWGGGEGAILLGKFHPRDRH